MSTACLFHLAQHLTKKRFLVVNISVSEDESRLLAEEGTEFEYQSSASKARKDSQEETPVALVKTTQSSIEGQFSMLATSLQEGFVNLGKILTNGIKTSHQNPSSSSGSSGSQSDQEDEQPPPKRSKTQELSDDDVTKDVNELISTLNKQTTDPPVNNLSQSTVLVMVAGELNGEKCGPEVAENLAKVVDKLLRTRLAEEKLKEKQNLYSGRKNVEAMVPTRVNLEIWQQLHPHTRSQDIRMQKVQNSSLKGLMPLAQLTNILPSTCRTVYHVRAENQL